MGKRSGGIGPTEEKQMTTRSSAMLKHSLKRVGIGMAVLWVVGGWWQDQPGGTGTRAVIAVAARICPGASNGAPTRPSVADGAHAIDRAVLRRGLDALGLGQRRCRRGAAA